VRQQGKRRDADGEGVVILLGGLVIHRRFIDSPNHRITDQRLMVGETLVGPRAELRVYSEL